MAVAHAGDMVVFVPHAVPGDVVDIEVRKKRRRYMEGVVKKFCSYSPDRVVPECSHFCQCGGCKWQDLPYEKQLYYKQKQVTDNLIRIGHLTLPEINPIIGSEKIYGYRNKLEFTFSDSRWFTSEEISSGLPLVNAPALGFHVPGFFDKVVDIERCFLQDSRSDEIRNGLRQFAIGQDIPFFNIRGHHGLLRTLVVRISSIGEIMVIVNFYDGNEDMRNSVLDYLSKSFPYITSLMYVVNPKPHDSFADLDVLLHSGRDYILEEMEGLKFKIGPKSFYQTNSEQAYRLYSVVRDMADFKGHECVYDLYTGTGTIANFVADRVKRVIGVEYVPEAIEDAKENSAMNNISNTEFYAGDMKNVLTPAFVKEKGRPDVVILDPPRAGIHQDVIDCILDTAPETIIYVSCNPATQARDLALLQNKYDIVAVQPVDMFPQTHHVENVVKLSIKS